MRENGEQCLTGMEFPFQKMKRVLEMMVVMVVQRQDCIYLLKKFFLVALCAMWDLSSMTKDRTWDPGSESAKS